MQSASLMSGAVHMYTLYVDYICLCTCVLHGMHRMHLAVCLWLTMFLISGAACRTLCLP
jgi:hypothetical protein